MKLVLRKVSGKLLNVAPFMGAWIETHGLRMGLCFHVVAPFMGAWIETPILFGAADYRGVAPFMGAWIETPDRVRWL